MGKKIIIIGAGMGGLAAGIYGQVNGYKTEIFEQHTIPGGQCTAYRRKGYTFDVCIHHLFGCRPGSTLNNFWQELGAMPREIIRPADCATFRSPDGRFFHDYYDPSRLQEELLTLAPEDKEPIMLYLNAIKKMSSFDFFGTFTFGDFFTRFSCLPRFVSAMKYFSLTLDKFGERFKNPLLQRAFPLLRYSLPDIPLAVQLFFHTGGITGDIGWARGGSFEFARSIEQQYIARGGTVHYDARVKKILTQNDKAVGIELEDGSSQYADIVISDADGRKTILDMLEGKYLNTKIRNWCEPPVDETNWAVHVFLGVKRDLSREPSTLVLLLDKPVTIAGKQIRNLEMQIYGYDKSMAPEGKGVIKVELFSQYSYWKALAANPAAYKAEKEHIQAQVIEIIQTHFPGIGAQVETSDIPTPLTWEKYMGGTHGFANMPARKFDLIGSVTGTGFELTLPGLKNFYFTGVWATMAGALFMNALSGKKVIELITKNEGKKFLASEGPGTK